MTMLRMVVPELIPMSPFWVHPSTGLTLPVHPAQSQSPSNRNFIPIMFLARDRRLHEQPRPVCERAQPTCMQVCKMHGCSARKYETLGKCVLWYCVRWTSVHHTVGVTCQATSHHIVVIVSPARCMQSWLTAALGETLVSL